MFSFDACMPLVYLFLPRQPHVSLTSHKLFVQTALSPTPTTKRKTHSAKVFMMLSTIQDDRNYWVHSKNTSLHFSRIQNRLFDDHYWGVSLVFVSSSEDR